MIRRATLFKGRDMPMDAKIETQPVDCTEISPPIPHPGLAVYQIGADHYLFRGGAGDVVVRDRKGVLNEVLALERHSDRLTAWLEELGVQRRAEADAVLCALQDRGLFTSSLTPNLDLLAYEIGSCRRGLEQRVHAKPEPARSAVRSRIAILGTGPDDMAANALSCLGFEPSTRDFPDGESVAALILLMGSDVQAGDEYNRLLIESRLPGVFVTVDHCRIVIGPVVVPGQSGCFACYHQRRRANAHHPEVIDACQSRPLLAPICNRSELAWRVATHLAAIRVALVAGGLSHLAPAGELLELDLLTLSVRKGKLLRIPRCPACGVRRHQSAIRAIRAATVE